MKRSNVHWLKDLPKGYILDGRKVVPVADLFEWARWFENADRRVGFDDTKHFSVSTVFIGLDHNFTSVGPPMVFETMVFEKQPTFHKLLQRWVHEAAEQMPMHRYSTWREAEAGHLETVRLCMEAEAASFKVVNGGKR